MDGLENQWNFFPRQRGWTSETNRRQALRLYKTGLSLSRRHFAEAESRSWIRALK